MVSVGIIANPASGRDIRRLVAHGSVFSNNEKVNIVRRAVLAMSSVGVEKVYFMPDNFRIGRRAIDGVKVRLATEELDLPVRDTGEDSHTAALAMVERGVGCIITLGGDGTNRSVAKGCGEVPLVAISTGTNNVFPTMIEGTVAGLAAGLVASGTVATADATRRTKRLEISVDGEFTDIALVDAAVSTDSFIGARAIWELARVRQLVLARAGVHYLGLSSIGGVLYPEGLGEEQGLALELGPSPLAVYAPIGPGLLDCVTIASHRVLHAGEPWEMELSNCTLALDGEREIEIGRPRRVTIGVSRRGPLVIDVARTLGLAARLGVFVNRPPGDTTA